MAQQWPALDWIFVGVLVFSLVLGAWRGVTYELLSIASWAAAFVAAQWFAEPVGQWLPMAESVAWLRYATGFIAVFILALVGGTLISVALKKLWVVTGLGPLDRSLGAIFGVIRGVVLLLVLTVLVQMTPLRTASWWTQAQGPLFAEWLLTGLQPFLPAALARYLQ